MIPILRLRPVALAAAVCIACSDDAAGPDGDACPDETSSVEATVTVGQSSVAFDWTPRCSVALLLVEEEASDRWSISTPEESWTTPALANRIAPPVTYGEVPAGITESFGPEPLVPGQSYELVLWSILPSGSTAQCLQRFESACLLEVEAFTR